MRYVVKILPDHNLFYNARINRIKKEEPKEAVKIKKKRKKFDQSFFMIDRVVYRQFLVFRVLIGPSPQFYSLNIFAISETVRHTGLNTFPPKQLLR